MVRAESSSYYNEAGREKPNLEASYRSKPDSRIGIQMGMSEASRAIEQTGPGNIWLPSGKNRTLHQVFPENF